MALLLAAVGTAQADIFMCVGEGGHKYIQSDPCGRGQSLQKRYSDGKPVKKPAKVAKSKGSSGGQNGHNGGTVARSEIFDPASNRQIVCAALDEEKALAERAIKGEKVDLPAGEDPKQNLVKIERERGKVGCGKAGA